MKNIGLVLSGGMAKGAYQIGALQAIDEFFKPSDFSFISSASIGALNSYAYLTHNINISFSVRSIDWANPVLLREERGCAGAVSPAYYCLAHFCAVLWGF